MKAKHRHELKTNELADWIANFPQWAKDNLKTIIYISAVILVAVVGVYAWKNHYKVGIKEQTAFTNLVGNVVRNETQIILGRDQGIDTSFSLVQTANELKKKAADTNDDQMAALALLKHAQALRAELHYRPGTISKEEFADQINKAKASYAEVLGKASVSSSLKATATLGLGLCAEELGNTTEAKKIYNEVIANPDFEHTTAAAQAKFRLVIVDGLQEKVVFVKAAPAPKVPDLKPAVIGTPAPDSDVIVPNLPAH